MSTLEYDSFDWENYIFFYEDLQNDNINTKEKAWNHWKKHGKNEGRLYFDLKNKNSNAPTSFDMSIDDYFDWEKYVNYYEDLKNDNINTKEKALRHWIKHGEKEGRIYFTVSDENSNNTYNSIEYINFDWEMYVNFYEDLKSKKNKEHAWEHWNKNGMQENRIYFDLNNSASYKEFDFDKYLKNQNLKRVTTKEEAFKSWLTLGYNEDLHSFSNKNTTKKLMYSFGNLFFVNLACHYLSMKYNILFDYEYYDVFSKLGVELFIGKNTYKNDLLLTNENFFSLIESNEIKKENITLSDNFNCITTDFCLFIKKYFWENSENQNKITQCNLFKDRYLSNKDLYIYVFIDDSIDESFYKQMFEYYSDNIQKIKYSKIYLSSNNIEHEICKKLIDEHYITIDEREICEQIMFASTCKNLILSNDNVSLLIGLFNFFSKHVYYPTVTTSKYTEIFRSLGWKGVDISKITKNKPKTLSYNKKENNQADSPTDEWYDSPFIRPKPVKTIKPVMESKPKLKVRLTQGLSVYDEPVHIKFDNLECTS
jgi:hypothetical protein